MNIDWSYWIPRIMTGIFIWLFLWGGASNIIRWWRRRRGQQTTTQTSTRRIKENLTPVEAAVLLGHNNTQVMKIILFLLYKKDTIKIISRIPLKMEKTGRRIELKYYERDLMHAIRRDGTINMDMVEQILRKIRNNVNRKMQRYNIDATKTHYTNKVNRVLDTIEQSLVLRFEEG